MVARRYEFYFRVAKQFYERAQRVSKIFFLPRENKIHIFKPPCKVRVPDEVVYEIYEWFSSQKNTLVYIINGNMY